MRRTIENRLIRWKASGSRKPLIVRGARQVGKTFTLSRFGREMYDDFVAFDFERNKRLARIFAADLDPKRILSELEVEAGRRIPKDRALVFFDEVQACPEAVASLRYFFEEMPELHIVAAGSLLELALGDVSFPVGRVQFEWLRPLTFAEFLSGTGSDLLQKRLPSVDQDIDIPEAVHLKFLEQLRRYFIVGGMPEAVMRYAETGSFADAAEVHRALIAALAQSFVKYHKRANTAVLENLLEQIPRRVGCQIKYSHLEPHRHTETVKSALKIMERALIVTRVQSTSAQGLPLGASVRPKIFKIVFLDIGLMQHLAGIDPSAVLHQDDLLKIYRGALAEQYVGQQLLAAGGSETDRLYYWSRARPSSSAEVDYLISRQGRIHAIEVKAGPRGRLKSLAVFQKEHPKASPGLVLSPSVRRKTVAGGMMFLPIYTGLT